MSQEGAGVCGAQAAPAGPPRGRVPVPCPRTGTLGEAEGKAGSPARFPTSRLYSLSYSGVCLGI